MMRPRFAAWLVVLALGGLTPIAAAAQGEGSPDAFNPVIGRTPDAAAGTHAGPHPCAHRDATTPPELRTRPACAPDRDTRTDRC